MCVWGTGMRVRPAGSLTVYSGTSDTSLAEMHTGSLVVDLLGVGALSVGEEWEQVKGRQKDTQASDWGR